MTLGHAHGKLQMRQQLLDAAPGESATFGMTGTSAAMQTLYRQLAKIVRADVPVLLRGESGVGKELVARAIHRLLEACRRAVSGDGVRPGNPDPV